MSAARWLQYIPQNPMLVIFREITDLAEAAQSLDLSTENKPKGAKHQVRHAGG